MIIMINLFIPTLPGMLLSSVSLGLLSDKYGRISCLKTGFTISIVSTFLAIFAHNYLLFNVAILLMSYAQVGVGNALCTLGEYQPSATLKPLQDKYR